MNKEETRNGLRKWWRKPFIWILLLMTAAALCPDFLANGLPLYAVREGQARFPVFEKKAADWGLGRDRSELNQPDVWLGTGTGNTVWAPIRYSPNQTDRLNDRFQKPHFLREDTPPHFPHYLGTDELGHDVASVLIHGTSISFFIGVLSMALAAGIGILIGAAAGFWGDDRLRATNRQSAWMAAGAVLMWFYGIQVHQIRFAETLGEGGIAFLRTVLLALGSMAGVGAVFLYAGRRIPFMRRGKKIRIPVDFILSRFIEWMVVIPKIILILAVAAIVKPSILLPALVIGFTSWPSIARFTRAEMLHVRHSDYIRSAETFGISETRLFFRHALPNSLGPVPSLVAFGIAGAVLAESTLSFLGIGIPPEVFTWGKLLAQGRANPSAWWVTLLPGLMIFLTITCFHRLGETLQGKDRADKRFLAYFR